MDLTDERRKQIDAMSYRTLLSRWRFDTAGDPWFQGETGEYWKKCMAELRDSPETDHVAISKEIGWG
jgi:hypothetical protein